MIGQAAVRWSIASLKLRKQHTNNYDTATLNITCACRSHIKFSQTGVCFQCIGNCRYAPVGYIVVHLLKCRCEAVRRNMHNIISKNNPNLYIRVPLVLTKSRYFKQTLALSASAIAITPTSPILALC